MSEEQDLLLMAIINSIDKKVDLFIQYQDAMREELTEYGKRICVFDSYFKLLAGALTTLGLAVFIFILGS